MVDSVAQLVEQYTFNVWVLGSSPSGITTESRSLQVIGFEGFSFYWDDVAGITCRVLPSVLAHNKNIRLSLLKTTPFGG